MTDITRKKLNKLYRATMRSHDAATELRTVEKEMDDIDEELADKASKLERRVNELHRELDEKLQDGQEEELMK